MENESAPDTIVLVHGLWMTPRSWEEWVPYYEGKGYKVVTPTYPGFEVEVEALREDPTPIATATVPATVAHIAEAITALDTPPIIMGHSFGGTLTQLLLDRGCGAAGVAIDSAPTEGVHVSPALADQVAVPGPQRSAEPAQGVRLHARRVPLRVHEHAQRGGLAEDL